LQERGIHKTRLEQLLLHAAADDITAWCLLAVVIAIVKLVIVGSLYVISLALLCLSNAFIVKPFLKRIGDLYAEKDNIGAGYGYFLCC
jgi:Kef-type K+ transport system membrane component KefB